MSWPEVSLGRLVVDMQPGFACRPTDEGAGTPQLRTNNVSADGRLNLAEVKRVSANDGQLERYLMAAGDVLFNNTNSPALVGKTAYFDRSEQFLFSNHMTRIRTNSELLDGKFLARFLHWTWSVGGFAKMVVQWVSQAAINRAQLASLPVPLPTPSEQRRVVELLDQAYALRRKRAEADTKVERILPALFLKMFGDPETNPRGFSVVPLGNVIADGPQNGLYKPASAYGTGTRILRIDSFYSGQVIDLSTLKRLELTPDEVEKYGLRTDDIVINRVNSEEYLGKSTIVPALDEPVVFESNMMRFRVDPAVAAPLFVIAHLQCPFTRKDILRKAKRAINQASINQQDVRALKFLKPPKHSQLQFAAIVEQASIALARTASAKAKLRMLFDVLLQRAFSGDLTASWREAHIEELLREMEQQARYLATASTEASE